MKIGDIARVQVGVYAKNSPQNANTVCLQVGSYDANRELTAVGPTISDRDVNSTALLYDKDLLFAAKGSNNFCVLFRPLAWNTVASSSFLIVRIRDRERVMPEYLCWYMNLASTRRLLEAEAKGTGIPSITKASLSKLDVPVPHIGTQRMIVEVDRLQRLEKQLLSQIMEQQRQIVEYKLKNMIENDERPY